MQHLSFYTRVIYTLGYIYTNIFCTFMYMLIKLLYYFQNTSTIFLKANLEYLRGNYKKAMRLLNSATIENLDFK